MAALRVLLYVVLLAFLALRRRLTSAPGPVR
jgi:hypothetical protein